MEDRLIGYLGFAVGLRVSHSSELCLEAQVVEIVYELTGVELPAVIKDDGMRDAETGDDVPPNEPSYFNSGYRGYSLNLYLFGKVVDRHKKILTLSRSFEERVEDINALCGERQGADDWRHGVGRESLDGGELLTFIASPNQCHGILSQTGPVVASANGHNS